MKIKNAYFRFEGELAKFLSLEDKKHPLLQSFRGRQSVKHLIESIGLPHTEIGDVRVNGKHVNSSYIVQEGDYVTVYEIIDFNSNWLATWPKQWNNIPKFLLDNHLGKLAIYLRVLGFDAIYRNNFQDNELSQLSKELPRLLLTRDRGLLMRNEIIYGYCVRSKEPKNQIAEIITRFELINKIKPFQRCLRCNGRLTAIDKAEIIDRLEPLTKIYYNEFHICNTCDNIYWKGSHFEHMQKLLNELMLYYSNSQK
jgi:uncharacterized protein with PIN domain